MTPYMQDRVSKVTQYAAEGLKDEEIAIKLHITASYVRTIRCDHNIPSGFDRSARLIKGRTSVRLIDTIKRKCLKCGKPFDSTHVGNRICQQCKSNSTYTSNPFDEPWSVAV